MIVYWDSELKLRAAAGIVQSSALIQSTNIQC